MYHSKLIIDNDLSDNFSDIPEECIVATYQRSNEPNPSSGYLANNVQLMVLNLKTKEIIDSGTLGEIWYSLKCKWCNPEICDSPYCCNYKAEKDNIDAQMIASTSQCNYFS